MALSPVLVTAVGRFIDNLSIVREVIEIRSNAMASSISFKIVEMTLEDLVRFRADIVDIKGRTGVGDYMRRIYGDDTIDITTRLNAVQTAVETAGTNIRALMPKDGNGWVLAYQLNADAADTVPFIFRVITPAQSAGVKANLDSIVAAIDALYAELSA
jgi:hypothetical protein